MPEEIIVLSAEHKALVDKVADHMEFLGYKVERDPSSPKKLFTTGSGDHLNCNVTVDLDVIALTIGNSITDYAKKNRQEFLEFVNNLNSKSSYATFVAVEDGRILIYMPLMSPYEKSLFGKLLARWDRDGHLLFTLPESKKFIP